VFLTLQTEKSIDSVPQGILINDAAKIQLMCAKLITLSNEALQYIEKIVLQIANLSPDSKAKPENSGTTTIGKKTNMIWRRYGCYILTNLHKVY